MFFRYFAPHTEINRYVSSYYQVTLPGEVADIMRAEIANLRLILAGEVVSDLDGEMKGLAAPRSLLCGPTFRASRVIFKPGTLVLGAAITPLGWRKLFGVSAEDYADRYADLSDLVDNDFLDPISAIFETNDAERRVALLDDFFRAVADTDRPANEAFVAACSEWLIEPEPEELPAFLARVGLSHRQVDRLCKMYFGAAPKKLHRKFRALHAANRLCWENLTDWRDIAASGFYDQAHFIREFKAVNGRTPKEFIDGPHLLVRATLEERRRITHASPFSLIG
ncbi:MAG: helix-turn-helix domain-containing protein [Alphaproteobacteria bacterium]|nr:helix-turn-helix domain-containing protein [Alphaproteobacteria bacterium]